MKKIDLAVFAISALAFGPVGALASSDDEALEEECRQAAADENIATTDIPDFIAECVAAALAGEGGETAQEASSEGESSE